MDIKEVNGKLICEKYNHNENIIMIAMEESLPIQQRLLCGKCVKQERIVKMLGIDQVEEMIKGKQQKQNTQQRSKDLQIIKEYQQQMKNILTQLLQDFQEILRISQQWIYEYNQKDDNTKLVNLIKGLELLNEASQLEDIELIGSINKSYFKQISSKFKKMITSIRDFKQPYDLLKQLKGKSSSREEKQQIQEKIESQIRIQAEQQQIIQNQQDIKQNISQIKLINTVKQEEWCGAIAFNSNGDLMVTGCEMDIKVWKFDKGQMIENKKLNGHTETVYCLAFSKKINWFVSGGSDKKIRCWTEQANGEWISTQPESQHTDYINCLLLNSNEDELISCSNDNTIKVWSVNCQSNQLDYDYKLDYQHLFQVDCISMNEKETYLAS